MASHLNGGSAEVPATLDGGSEIAGIERIGEGAGSLLDLRGWTFSGLSHLRLERVDFSCASMVGRGNFGWDATFVGCVARRLSLRDASMFGNWVRTDLSYASFTRVDISDASFAQCGFGGAVSISCAWVGCSFEGCVFEDARWEGGRISGCTFVRTTFRRLQLEGVEVSSCKFVDCTFEGLEGRPTTAANAYVGCRAPEVLAERDSLDAIASGDYRRFLRGGVGNAPRRAPRASTEAAGGKFDTPDWLALSVDPPLASATLLAWLKLHGGIPITRLAEAEYGSSDHEWHVASERAWAPHELLLGGQEVTRLASPPTRPCGVARYSREGGVLRAVSCWSMGGDRFGAILVAETGSSRLYLHWSDSETRANQGQQWVAITRAWSDSPFDPEDSTWLIVDAETGAWRQLRMRRGTGAVTTASSGAHGEGRVE